MTTPLSYDVGAKAMVNERACIITAQTGADEVLICFEDDGHTEAVHTFDLKPFVKPDKAKPKALDAFHEQDLETARKRFDAIAPILNVEGNRGEAIRERAKELGLHISTLYRWLQSYESVERKSALAPRRRGKRKRRLDKKLEAIIQHAIEKIDLSKQCNTQRRVIDEVKLRCRAARLKPPHPNTIRSRIKDVSPQERTKRRRGAKAARDQYAPATGHFPNADQPLSYWQMDHTKLDIILLDDERRKPIGRPWLTLAIDVNTRMIAGYYLALEAPSSFSVGMCMSHAILEKHDYLEKVGVKGSWPVWGFPGTVHVDNGKDFRGKSIQKSLDEYNINIEWRPVKRPEFGGHVERMFNTLNQFIHGLRGTTKSNVKERGEYNSEKEAVFTFAEFETLLANQIVNVYHKSIHSSIQMTPEKKWNEGLFGSGKKKGPGLPPRVADPERLRLDFLPYETRSVQRDGIAWDKIHYFADVLRPLINAKKGGRTQKFVVRRDPRDISRIYFLDPDIGEYYEIPYRDLSKPSVTLWEYRFIQSELRKQGLESFDEDAIFDAMEVSQAIEENAKKQTTKARRRKQIAINHAPAQKQPRSPGLRVVIDNSPASDDNDAFELDDNDIHDDWEDWT